MKATIDCLLKDIKSSEIVKVRITIHTGAEVIMKSYNYTGLSLKKDSKGAIYLGNYESKEGYVITHEHEIEKIESEQGAITYHISKDEISLVDVYIN